MSSSDGFIAQVVGTLSRALEPLLDATTSIESLRELLTRLGWATTPTAEELAAVAAVAPAIEKLAADVDAGADAVTLVADVAAAVATLAALEDTVPGGSAPFDNPAFWSALPEDLLALLVADDLETYLPRTFGVLTFLGALGKVSRPTDAMTGRLAYEARVVDWGAIGRAAGSPATFFGQVYGWGRTFDHAKCLTALAALGKGLGGAAAFLPPPTSIAEGYIAPKNPERGSIQLASVSPFVLEPDSLDALVTSSVLLLPLPPEGAPSSPPEGFLVWPTVTGESTATIDLQPLGTLTIEGDIQANPLKIQVRPGGASVENATAPFSQSVRVDVAPMTPFIMAGSEDGTRLELLSAHFGIAASGDGSSTEVAIDAALDDGNAVLDLGEADSFLRGVIGDSTYSLSLAAEVRWSSVSGLTFSGSTTASITIPVDFTIAGVLLVTEIQIALGAGETDQAQLTVSASGGLDLGPIGVVVDEIGLEVLAAPATLKAPGNFCLVDIALGFKPPKGLGIGVDAEGIVTGGGYLYLDPDKGEYAGVGDLAMLGVGITIVGVLATKLPDGSDGWSMFLSLSITFTGMQLGFGFTLNGLGGLVGVNRGLDEDALADGVRTGALDSILFPEDAIANAPQILSDIGVVFPAALGQFVFGPIAKIGWGTPTLISLELGIILQLPEPLTVTLLGSLESLLPSTDAAVVELRLDVAGTRNITEGTLKIDATLRDSRVLTLDLSGDMAVRASFFDNPTFLVSFGGFHPDFPAPADFPTLARLSIALDTGDDLRIQLGGYFALTSNTVQFGASFYFWAQAIGFTAEGGTSFDALIYFSPFGFVVELRLWVSVSAGSFDLLGVDLRADLTGPNPWHVAGSASFKILGVKKSLDLQAMIGQPKDDEPKETVFVEDLLIAELGREDAWSALAPTVDGDGVVLAERDPHAREVHPAGRIEVRQRVVPLATRIDHFGEANLGGVDQFELAAPRIGTSALVEAAIEEVEDWFAAAQYFDLGEDEKLASPSFEPMPAGLRLGDERARAGEEAELTCDHEIAYRDPHGRAARREHTGALYNATRLTCDRSLSMSGALAARTAARLPRSTKSTGMFGVNAPTYVAVNTNTGEVATALTPKEGISYYAARDAVRGADSANRAVVPAYELELLA